MKTYMVVLCALAIEACDVYGQTTVLWNESVNGEMSQNFDYPTQLGNLQIGNNIIIGATECVPYGNNWGEYPDIFIFNVPDGYYIDEVYVQVDLPNIWAWIGDSTLDNRLAFSLNPSSGELFPQWGITSLGADTYGMYMQNDDGQAYTTVGNYELDFVVEPAPEPGTFGLLLLGAGVFILRSCRKSRLFS